jgi:hypothetical protein
MDNLALGVALYTSGFVVAGAVVGLLWPWRRDLVGRFVLGIIGAAIVFAFIARMESGPVHTWGRFEGVMILALALLFGVPIGWQFGKRW